MSIIIPRDDNSVPLQNTGRILLGGSKNVTTAGTREQLFATEQSCRSIIITAKEGNGGVIVVGDSGVIADSGTRNGIPLVPLSSVTISVDDASLIYLDTTNSGDGVTYLIIT